MIQSSGMDFLKKRGKLIISLTAGVIGVCFILGGSYYLGFQQGLTETRHIIVEGVSDPQKGPAISFSTFWEAWNILKSRYVFEDKVENNEQLLFGAISGLVDSLKDPYTIFLPPEDTKKFNEEIKGEFGGIGAEIGVNENNQIVIIAPLKNSPAFRAGIRAGDKIVKIDDEITVGLSVEEAVKRIRGEKGTTVTLTIIPDKDTKDREVPIVRDIIQLPTLESKQINFEGKDDEKGEIFYIKLDNFYEKAPSQFYQAALKNITYNTKGIILDIRNNPGGYLDAAVYIAGWFLEKGTVVVKEVSREESLNQKLISQGPAIFSKKPVVVLINKGSASASEILAGALQENGKATLLGQKSFGKGTVQELLSLNGNSMIKITVAHWLTPKGNQIDKNGITPDKELADPEAKNGDFDSDPWIKEAVKELQDKIQKVKLL